MNQIFLPGFLVLILLAIFVLFVFKLISYRRKIVVLQADNSIKYEFSEYANTCLLSLNEGQYRYNDLVAGKLYDDLGSTIAAARLSFEYLMLREYSGAFKENEVFNKAYGYIEDAYYKVKDLGGESGYEADPLFDIVRKMAAKASLLSGVKVIVRPFGISGKVNASCIYLIFFVVRRILTDVVGLYKAGLVEINILQKQSQVSVIIQAKDIVLERSVISGLRSISKNLTVFADASGDVASFNNKIVIVIPYI